ncbi:MAG TPA: DUF6220 domain-containing protein [Candidatus Limnocylindria bacterium]|jgi:hypothetical protein
MLQTWRYLFAAAAVLFLVGVVVQVYLIGATLFAGHPVDDHRNLGYWLSLAPVISLLLAWPARAGQRTVLLCAGLLVTAFVQSVLPGLRDAAGWLAALHPLNAMLVFGLSLVVARQALRLAGEQAAMPMEDPVSSEGQAPSWKRDGSSR